MAIGSVDFKNVDSKSSVCLLALIGLGWFWLSTVPESRDATKHFHFHHGTRDLVSPLQPPEPGNAEEIELGRRLFGEKKLSGRQTVSCLSCHNLAAGGVDHLARSIGDDGRPGIINAPTVYNASLNSSLFWDGRVATLEEQANEPILNPTEMNSNWALINSRLNQDAGYRDAFESVYQAPASRETVVKALAAYERTLVTLNSPFDRYLRGESQAMSTESIRGYEKFRSYGCISCHQGANLGGNIYEKFGIMGDYFQDRGNIKRSDWGRFNVTHREEDRFVFRVPSLRNVAETAPYFHDGSAADLKSAIRVMSRYQLGRQLDDHEVSELEAFLACLSGTAHP